MRVDFLSDIPPDSSLSSTPTMDALAHMDTSITPVRSLLRPAGAALLSLLVLSGCSLLKETRESIEQDIETTDALRDQMRERSEPFAVLSHARARIAGEEIRLKEEKEILPPLFNEHVTYVTSGQTLQETLETVSRQVGMPIWLTEFVSDKESVGKNSRSSSDDDERGRVTIQIHYDGPLHGLLDQLAQSARLHWRYYEGRVEFFLYETRHFYVNLPMGSREIKSSVSSSASGGGEGGGSGDTGSITIEMDGVKVDPYNAITRAIAAILMEDDGQTDVLGNGETDIEISELASGGSSGSSSNDDAKRGASRVVVAPEMGMVTVTAQPTALDRVADYIEHINRRFSRNVMIDVKIYDVTLDDGANTGLSAEALSRRIRGLGAVLTAGAGGIGIVRNATTRGIVDPSTDINNTVLTALRSFGRTSLVQSGQVMAINGQPAPLQIATERSYISSITTQPSAVGGGGAIVPGSTSYETSKISDGLTANFLPHMLADNRILLQYQLTTRTAQLAPAPGKPGEEGVRLPEISSQTVQQQAFVRDSEAIVLFGFGENRGRANGRDGLVLNHNRDANQNRTQRVIVMQIFGGGPNGNAYM